MADLDQTYPPPRAHRARFWPLILILLLDLTLWILIWQNVELDRQVKIMKTGALILASCVLAFLWLVAFSRLPWRRRFASIGLLAALLGGFLALFRLREVSGDFVPIWEPRWKTAGVRPAGLGSNAKTPGMPNPTNRFWFPQYLGPGRDGILSGPTVLDDWKASPPKEIWRRPIAPSWCGFAIAGRYAVTMEQFGEMEAVTAYELMDGQPLWTNSYAAKYNTTIGGEGPRATPTVVGNVVYAFGGSGVLSATHLSDGKPLWSHDVLKDSGVAKLPDWGQTGAPLVVDDLVVVPTGARNGKSLQAFDTQTGALRWSGGDDEMSYGSPTLLKILGQGQILMFNNNEMTAHNPTNGAVLWRHPWQGQYPKVTLPVSLGEAKILLSSGYGAGAELLELTQEAGLWKVRSVWKTNQLKSKFANIINYDGSIYGLDDGIMVCLDPANGQRRWKDGRYGHGQMLLLKDRLLITSETGDLVLVIPSPEAWREMAKLKVFGDKSWNPPAVAGEFVLMRNHREAALYQLPIRP